MTSSIYSIFLSNKYTKWYFDIINNAKTKSYDCYTERHHILPRSLGGSDHPSNLVTLSAREHFICHYLLIKMTEKDSNYKMLNAFIIMKAFNIFQNRYVNSHLYESAKKKFSIIQSIKQKGNGNSQFGTCWISNFSKRKSKKIHTSDLSFYLDSGWVKKRVLNFDIFDSNGNKLPKTKVSIKNYTNYPVYIHRINNSKNFKVPEKLLSSNFFLKKSNNLEKIGFNFLADDLYDEYHKTKQHLINLRNNYCYREIRTMCDISYDRTITLLYQLFDII